MGSGDCNTPRAHTATLATSISLCISNFAIYFVQDKVKFKQLFNRRKAQLEELNTQLIKEIDNAKWEIANEIRGLIREARSKILGTTSNSSINSTVLTKLFISSPVFTTKQFAGSDENISLSCGHIQILFQKNKDFDDWRLEVSDTKKSSKEEYSGACGRTPKSVSSESGRLLEVP